jgi:hypothetical protein
VQGAFEKVIQEVLTESNAYLINVQ